MTAECKPQPGDGIVRQVHPDRSSVMTDTKTPEKKKGLPEGSEMLFLAIGLAVGVLALMILMKTLAPA